MKILSFFFVSGIESNDYFRFIIEIVNTEWYTITNHKNYNSFKYKGASDVWTRLWSSVKRVEISKRTH